MTDDKHLSIYLNDHLAGAVAGAELSKRAASNNRETEFAEPLDRIALEIAEDKTVLEEIMDGLDIRKNPLKEGAGWVAEKAGRLKFNGQIVGYSPLSRVVELDALVAGVIAKSAMWKVLDRLAGIDVRLDPAQLGGLIERAEAQRVELEALRLVAADIAFAGRAAL
jgi:hypothetical protein